MLIYIDDDFKCHVENNGTMRAYELPEFDGKCTEFIEGHRHVPAGEIWVREDNIAFEGGATFPWKDSAELDKAQAKYEHELLEQFRAELDDADAALAILGVTVDE